MPESKGRHGSSTPCPQSNHVASYRFLPRYDHGIIRVRVLAPTCRHTVGIIKTRNDFCQRRVEKILIGNRKEAKQMPQRKFGHGANDGQSRREKARSRSDRVEKTPRHRFSKCVPTRFKQIALNTTRVLIRNITSADTIGRSRGTRKPRALKRRLASTSRKTSLRKSIPTAILKKMHGTRSQQEHSTIAPAQGHIRSQLQRPSASSTNSRTQHQAALPHQRPPSTAAPRNPAPQQPARHATTKKRRGHVC